MSLQSATGSLREAGNEKKPLADHTTAAWLRGSARLASEPRGRPAAPSRLGNREGRAKLNSGRGKWGWPPRGERAGPRTDTPPPVKASFCVLWQVLEAREPTCEGGRGLRLSLSISLPAPCVSLHLSPCTLCLSSSLSLHPVSLFISLPVPYLCLSPCLSLSLHLCLSSLSASFLLSRGPCSIPSAPGTCTLLLRLIWYRHHLRRTNQ